MARYGKGGLSSKIGMSDYELNRGMEAHGLKGVEGNKAITHRAQQMAEDRDMNPDEIEKGHYLWDLAQRDLIKRGNEGGDPHGEYRDYNQQSEIDELYKMMEERDSIPEANAEPAAEIEPKMQPITYSSAVQDAKERTKAFMDGSQESYNIYAGAASTENNMVEDPDSEMAVANNKASTMGEQDPMLQSRHEDRNLNFNWSSVLAALRLIESEAFP